MADAFDAAWDVIKMGKEDDDEERRLIQHIVSMVMGMNDDEADSYGGGYLDALQGSGKELSDLVSRRFGETGGAKGGYMKEGDQDEYLDDWPYGGQMDDKAADALDAQGIFDDDAAYEAAMQAWLKENPYTPRPSNYYEAPSMVRGDMAKLMALIQSNPEMYHNRGYDGTMAGHFGGYSMKRPDMKGMYDSEYLEAEPVGDDYTGDYFGDDGNIRGTLSKVKLLDALKRMGLM